MATNGRRVNGPRVNEKWLAQNVELDGKVKAGDEIMSIAKEISDLTPRPTLEEYKFVNVFLPLFEGLEPAQMKYKVDLNNWVVVAGNRYTEVDVVDDKEPTKVLFTVPPLLDRMALKPTSAQKGSGTILNMVMTLQKLQRVRPGMAIDYFNNEMAARTARMEGPEDNILKHLRMWNDIFKRYGKPAILEIPGDPSTNTEGTHDAGKQDVVRAIDDADWELL